MADGETKKKTGRPKQEIVKDKLVCIVMNDEEMARFEHIEKATGKSKSEVMRAAFSLAQRPYRRTLGVRRNHQVGVWLNPAETAELERLQERLHTSKGGVFKYGLDLMYEEISANREKTNNPGV